MTGWFGHSAKELSNLIVRRGALAGILPIPLLHGAAGPADEIAIFGGIGAVLLILAFLSWRAGRERKKRRRRTRGQRH